MMLKKHWKLLLYAIFWCAVLAAAYFMFFAARRVTTITIRYDRTLSAKTENELSELIIQALKDGEDAHKVFLIAKNSVPAVNLVTINRLKPGHTRVIVKSERPWLLVKCIPSQHFILSSNGTYTPLRQYQKESITGLPHIIITCKRFSEDDQALLHCWAQRLPDNFFAQYHVTWNKKTELVIQDKHYPQLRIVATAKTRFTPRLHRDLEKIRVKLARKNKTKNWKADIRFKDQIVLAPIKKEKGTR